jgi:hypothetical protein
VTDAEWGHLLVFVDALAASGNLPDSDGFQPTPAGWDCVMRGPLDFDLLTPLVDGLPVELVPEDDRLWCRHCWASIVGPGGLPLTRDRLVAFLDREHVSAEAYSLDGGHPDERYVVDHRGHEWVVYYSERGLESGLRTFTRAADAYGDLRDQLLRDPTTRLR